MKSMIAAAALMLAAGMTAPAFAQGCNTSANGQVASQPPITGPLKGPGMGTGNNSAQDKSATTCETMVLPNGTEIPQNGPAVNDAGSNGAAHSR